MRSHRQKSSAEQAGPKSKRDAEIKFERNELELTRGCRFRCDRMPTTRNEMKQLVGSQQRSADVNDQLDQVGPDNRGDAAFESVDQRQHANDYDRPKPKMR